MQHLQKKKLNNFAGWGGCDKAEGQEWPLEQDHEQPAAAGEGGTGGSAETAGWLPLVVGVCMQRFTV